MERDRYFRRLLSRAWQETNAFKFAHRLWWAIAGLIATLAFSAYTRGLSSLKNAGDLVAVSLGGLALGFVGTFAHCLIRSTKLLDRERTAAIVSLESECDALRRQLEMPRITPEEQGRRDFVRQKLQDSDCDEIATLSYMAQHGTMTVEQMNKLFGNSVAINSTKLKGLVCDVSPSARCDVHFQLNASLAEAIKYHLRLRGAL